MMQSQDLLGMNLKKRPTRNRPNREHALGLIEAPPRSLSAGDDEICQGAVRDRLLADFQDIDAVVNLRPRQRLDAMALRQGILVLALGVQRLQFLEIDLPKFAQQVRSLRKVESLPPG